MAKKKYDAVATVGEYQKGGETKKRYLTVGAVFENDRGQLSMKLDALPTNKEWSGWISFYEPKQYDAASNSNQSRPSTRPPQGSNPTDEEQVQDDDDITF